MRDADGIHAGIPCDRWVCSNMVPRGTDSAHFFEPNLVPSLRYSRIQSTPLSCRDVLYTCKQVLFFVAIDFKYCWIHDQARLFIRLISLGIM
ncbi:hypothetical protein KM043_008880 [Ampulex compressa]|nr:hypothetical protein KM043_008880 [Ampulex compressa]